jgi:hypothetical protein
MRRGRRRQDDRWGGVLGPDLRGLRPYDRSRRWLARPLGRWWPQGNHRRHQHRRHQQVGGQEQDPEAAVPRWLGQMHHDAPCRAPSGQLPPSCPPRTAPTTEPADTASMAGSSACCSVAPRCLGALSRSARSVPDSTSSRLSLAKGKDAHLARRAAKVSRQVRDTDLVGRRHPHRVAVLSQTCRGPGNSRGHGSLMGRS